MFVVKLIGTGEGCDYTIGCNTVTVTLPASIKTMDEAVEYVTNQKEEGCIYYYGLEKVKSATIYEIKNFHELRL